MRIMIILLLTGLLASSLGCRSTKSARTPVDYRQDQATRQTQRDTPPEPANRQPLEGGGLQGQDVIDQPR